MRLLRDGSAVAHLRAALVGFAVAAAGGVMVADAFLAAFCVDLAKSSPAMCRAPAAQLPPAWLAFAARFNAAFFAGGGAGAASVAWLAELRGRRTASVAGALLTAAGSLAVALTPAHAHSPLLLARALQGSGAGGLSLSLLLWSAEAASGAAARMRRASATAAAGVLLANVASAALETVTDGWRYANALAAAPAVLLALLSCCCMPESACWLLRTRGRAAARAALQTLRRTDDVDDELEQLAAESSGVGWRQLWAARPLRRRLLVAIALQSLQQATGISVVLTYGALLFKDVARDGVASLVIVATAAAFASALVATRRAEAGSRRQALLLGALGMAVGHLVAAVVAAAGCDAASCSRPAGFAIVVSSALFAFSFAASWGSECSVYSAALFPASCRVKASSAATVVNWAAGALTVAVPGLFPHLQASGVFFLFAALSVGAGVFVAYKCPDTNGAALDDVALLFERASAAASDQSLHVLSPPPRKFDEVATPGPTAKA